MRRRKKTLASRIVKALTTKETLTLCSFLVEVVLLALIGYMVIRGRHTALVCFQGSYGGVAASVCMDASEVDELQQKEGSQL